MRAPNSLYYSAMPDFEIRDFFSGQKLNQEQAKYQVVLNLNLLMSHQFKLLLETKHLYQKVSFDPIEIVANTKPRISMGNDASLFRIWVDRDLPSLPLKLGHEVMADEPTLVIKNVKLSCRTCSRREAFAPGWRVSYPNDGSVFASLPHLLLLTYQCQGCQRAPEALLVRREGWEFQLHGRSPIEEVEIPKYLPKSEYRFYRDAIIAFNSGKILAAVFYLRTFIEQFARRLTGHTGKITGDEVMTAYSDTLPPALRDMMPSLREWYEKLSVPIHAAKEDAEVFEAAREAIERHFDMRRVHAIPEPKPAPDRHPEAADPAPQ